MRGAMASLRQSDGPGANPYGGAGGGDDAGAKREQELIEEINMLRKEVRRQVMIVRDLKDRLSGVTIWSKIDFV